MANNRRVFDLWFEIMRAELEELVHVPVTSRVVPEIPPPASAYRSQLLFEGPVHGVMYVTASASSLVQLSQMAAGEAVDPHAAWTEEGLEAWQIWLTAASGKLAIRLSEDIGDGSKTACTILLQGTTAVDGMDSAAGTDTAASGAAIEEWMLQAAGTEFALSVSAQVMFPDDDAAAAGVDEPELEKTSSELVETFAASQLVAGVGGTHLLEMPAVPREAPQAAQSVEDESLVDPPPASRTIRRVPGARCQSLLRAANETATRPVARYRTGSDIALRRAGVAAARSAGTRAGRRVAAGSACSRAGRISGGRPHCCQRRSCAGGWKFRAACDRSCRTAPPPGDHPLFVLEIRRLAAIPGFRHAPLASHSHC